MFLHNFKYFLKIILKNKSLLFWTFAFPILLGLFFNFAFQDIESKEKLDVIDIAIVDDSNFNLEENMIYKNAFTKLSKKHLFNIKYVNEQEAIKLLNTNKITGYIEFKNNTPSIVVLSNGINETMLKFVVKEIEESKKMIANITNYQVKEYLISNNLNINYNDIYSNCINLINQTSPNLEEIKVNNLSYTMIEFYTLIAMACLYGGMIGMTSINYTLANMGSNGKRISISKTKKSTIILSSIFASFIIQLIGVFLLLLFTIFVLNVDYGANLGPVILMTIVGSFAGLSFGVFIATALNCNENTKTGLIITFTMLGCFLSGMMGITMKYIVDKNIPIINKINPASMITDGFYALYYYTTMDRFYFNIISLLIFSIIMIIITSFNLRRKKYDSI